MNIALDYDLTYTEDRELWNMFIELAQSKGHIVTFVTYRDSRWGNEDILSDASKLGIEVVFTNGKQKEGVFRADIWIDDDPVTIPVASKLSDMHNGCLVNNDICDPK